MTTRLETLRLFGAFGAVLSCSGLLTQVSARPRDQAKATVQVARPTERASPPQEPQFAILRIDATIPRLRVSIIVVNTKQEADDILAKVKGGSSFRVQAVAHSVHSTSGDGGALDDDALRNLPAHLKDALRGQDVGGVIGPVSVTRTETRQLSHPTIADDRVTVIGALVDETGRPIEGTWVAIRDEGSIRVVEVRAGTIRPVAGADWWLIPGVAVTVGKGGARLRGKPYGEGATLRANEQRELILAAFKTVIKGRVSRNAPASEAASAPCATSGSGLLVSGIAQLRGDDHIVYGVEKTKSIFQLTPRFNTSAVVEAKITEEGCTSIVIRDGLVAKHNGDWMPFAGTLKAGSHIETIVNSTQRSR